MIGRTERAGLTAIPEHFTALVEIELHVRPGCVIGDEFELIPEILELFLAFGVKNQLAQRRVVAEVPHDIVVSGAEQSPLVFGVVRVEASTLANVERIGKY